MLTRKKSLKIQERLGMRIGIAQGTRRVPLVSTVSQALKVLDELYRVGFKAFVLPKEMFANVTSTTDLYKEHYGEFLKVKSLAKKYNIELAIRYEEIPQDPARLDSTLKIYSSIASIMDCRTFIIRPTFYPMMPHDQALRLVVHKINEIVSSMEIKTKIGVETTGRLRELGSLEDVIEISKRTSGTEPILNWAHIHARGVGVLRGESDFRNIMDKTRREMGQQWLGNAYFFFSGATYGPSGLTGYVPISKADISLRLLIKEIMSFGMKGTLIFEDEGREKSILDMLMELGDMVR